jgi:hypothetical protein
MPYRDPEKNRAANRACYQKHKAARRAGNKAWQVAHPERYVWLMRDAALRRKYGIGCDEFDLLSAAQKHVCAICGRPDPLGCLSVDHDHETGQIRGLLCRGCNVSLGRFDDSLELLERAIEYLKKGRA